MTKTPSQSSFHFRLSVFFVAASLLCLANAVFANDWGPSLGPSFPDEIGEFEPAIDEFEAVYEAQYEMETVPDEVSRPPRAKPLPSRQKPRRAAFHDGMEPSDIIVPQAFLEEKTADREIEAAAGPIPPTKKKKSTPTRRPTIETTHGEESIPTSAGEFAFTDTAFADTMDEGVISDMPYGDGLYNELSPAMTSSYLGPMMMKSFGTGMLDNLTFFGGVTGFRSEVDGDRSGNFGFSEGINWSGPATPQCTVSAQLGFRAVQSNINGSASTSSAKDSRYQYFVTAGLFKRDLSFPIQGGFVFDWMDDDFYGKVKVRQFRAELSARTFSNLEYGFLGGFGVTDKGSSFIDQREDPTGVLHFGVEAQKYYLLFVRKHLAAGGVTELRGGLTDRGDTILSGVAELPLNDRLAVNGGFTLMIPERGHENNGYRTETWDVSVGFVFYFRGGACSKPSNPCRPMFSVADNSSFFNRLVRH